MKLLKKLRGRGVQVSHGCVRLYPEDIERLFPRVTIGTPGEFTYQPVKVGTRGGQVYLETSADIYGLIAGITASGIDYNPQTSCTVDKPASNAMVAVMRFDLGCFQGEFFFPDFRCEFRVPFLKLN